MREETLARPLHPQTLKDGSVVYMEAGIRDKLQHGDPALGWEGDARLEVYQGPDRRLYVWRLEADGEHRLVCASRPDLPLDERLIRGLVRHDTRRGYDPAKSISAHNQRLEAERDAEGDAALSEAKQKVYMSLRKDLGAAL